MEHPFDRLVLLLHSFPSDLRYAWVMRCNSAVGLEFDPCRPLRIQESIARLNLLSSSHGISEVLLVAGVLKAVLDGFRKDAERYRSTVADDPHKAIAQLKRNLEGASSETKAIVSDALIDDLTHNDTSMIEGEAGFISEINIDITRSEEQVRLLLSDEYWFQWRMAGPFLER
jgi:hypothetical protein